MGSRTLGSTPPLEFEVQTWGLGFKVEGLLSRVFVARTTLDCTGNTHPLAATIL